MAHKRKRKTKTKATGTRLPSAEKPVSLAPMTMEEAIKTLAPTKPKERSGRP